MADEIDKLDPLPESVTLRSGLVVRLESLRSRQFLKMLRIITHGALPGLREAGLMSMDGLDSDEFMGRLLTVMLLSIPDAEDETIEFVRSLCYPEGLIERKNLNKQDLERNQGLWDSVDEELINPDLDDLVTIIEAVVKREAEDIQALGKRLASMFKLATRTGQLDRKSPNPSGSTSASSADSPGRSTSSRRNTGGQTKSSSTSASGVSDSASPQSESDTITHAGSASIG